MFQSMGEYKYKISDLTFFLHCNLSHLPLECEFNEHGNMNYFFEELTIIFLWMTVIMMTLHKFQ